MMRWHERENKLIPNDWALTKEGYETTNPSDAMDGFLLGIGQYKGYGLSFMTDVLTGVISGGGYGLMPYSDPKRLDVSHSITAINIEWFMKIEDFCKLIDDFVNTIKNLTLRPGFDEIFVPAGTKISSKPGLNGRFLIVLTKSSMRLQNSSIFINHSILIAVIECETSNLFGSEYGINP